MELEKKKSLIAARKRYP